MKLSVAYSFEPGLIEKLSVYPEVREVYGKLNRDIIGGGRSSYTLRPANLSSLKNAISISHKKGINFNYLINGASLDGSEQTRAGRNRIENFLTVLEKIGVDALTVASPYLIKVIKRKFPKFSVRVSAFTCIDSISKAKQWEEMGADTLCLSAIACNRDLALLERIRKSVTCELQLIVNANCMQNCAHELTHMNLLTQSSRNTDKLKGFCLDYCFLHCSRSRILNPELFIRSIWIRPEDLHYYESIGIDNFKIVERSSPSELMLKRVKAYIERRFDGNLMELVGAVAQIKKELKPTKIQYFKMILSMAKPWHVKIKSMLLMKKYAQDSMLHEFEKDKAWLYIDNRKLDGYFEGLQKKDCRNSDCSKCEYCKQWFKKTGVIDSKYREYLLGMADSLENGLKDGNLW